MLKFGNKEFRNLQEQVLKNMQNIANIKEGTAVLSEFGIKVVGEVDTLAELPSVADYKAAHQDWEYGDAFAVGTEAPYALYILTRENDSITADHWFDIGNFPAPGPQGAQGPQGEVGPQGQQGNQGEPGVDAGFGSVLATAQTLPAGSVATATVTASGPNTAKEFSFTFGIPRGADGGQATWGSILGDLSNQRDLKDILDSKQAELVSGTNIKTINNQSIVGSGNIEINSGVWGNITGTLSDQTDLANALAEKQPVIDASHKLSASLVSGLATVATTGAYADLDGKPTIGTGTITIKRNGETLDSFGLNQTADQNINIAVPTKTSDLNNDSDFTTKTYVDTELALKQDVISDLSDIRAGAALGATALQSIPSEYITDSELATELATKQDVISDLATIRSGAAAGATAVQPAAIANMVTTNTVQTITGEKSIQLPGVEGNLGLFRIFDGDASESIMAIQGGVSTGDSFIRLSADEYQIKKSGQYKDIATVDQIPTTTSELTNNSGFITSADIPTNVSAFTNDAGYITSSAIPTNYVTTDTQQAISGYKQFNGNIFAAGARLVVGDGTDLRVERTLSHTGWPILDGSNKDYLATYYSNGIVIEDNEEVDEDAPYYLAFPKRDGILATTSQIPTAVSQLTNDSGFITSTALASYVTTNTNQNIGGTKTFTGRLVVSYDSDNDGPFEIYDTDAQHGTTFEVGNLSADNVLTLPTATGTLALTSEIPTNNNQLTNGAGYQTASDVSTAISGQTKETWTFTLADGTTTTKTIVLG